MSLNKDLPPDMIETNSAAETQPPSFFDTPLLLKEVIREGLPKEKWRQIDELPPLPAPSLAASMEEMPEPAAPRLSPTPHPEPVSPEISSLSETPPLPEAAIHSQEESAPASEPAPANALTETRDPVTALDAAPSTLAPDKTAYSPRQEARDEALHELLNAFMDKIVLPDVYEHVLQKMDKQLDEILQRVIQEELTETLQILLRASQDTLKTQIMARLHEDLPAEIHACLHENLSHILKPNDSDPA